MATMLKEVDAVCVGVGFTGSILARELTKAGLKVVGLERGANRTSRDDFALPGSRFVLWHRRVPDRRNAVREEVEPRLVAEVDECFTGRQLRIEVGTEGREFGGCARSQPRSTGPRGLGHRVGAQKARLFDLPELPGENLHRVESHEQEGSRGA